QSVEEGALREVVPNRGNVPESIACRSDRERPDLLRRAELTLRADQEARPLEFDLSRRGVLIAPGERLVHLGDRDPRRTHAVLIELYGDLALSDPVELDFGDPRNLQNRWLNPPVDELAQ